MKPNEFGESTKEEFFTNDKSLNWMDVELHFTGSKALKNMDKYRAKRIYKNKIARASRRANRV